MAFRRLVPPFAIVQSGAQGLPACEFGGSLARRLKPQHVGHGLAVLLRRIDPQRLQPRGVARTG